MCKPLFMTVFKCTDCFANARQILLKILHLIVEESEAE